MGMSPVLQAFFEGQQQRSKQLQEGQDWQLRAKHLQELSKQFDVSSKQKQQEIDQAAQRLKLNTIDVHNTLKNQLSELMSKGQVAIPQTGSMQSNPMFGQPSGLPFEINNQPQSIQVPGMPPVGAQIPIDVGFGPETMGRPQTEKEAAIEQFKALAPLQMAHDVEKYNATIGNTKAKDLENKLDLMGLRNDSNNEIANIRATTAKYQADLNLQKSLLGQQMHFYDMMAGIVGPENVKDMMDPERFKSLVRNTGVAVGLGHQNVSELNPKLKASMNTWMRENGWSEPVGGAKFSDELGKTATSANRLINDFDMLNTEQPAMGNTAGGAFNTIKNLPGINKFTDVGQRFQRFGDNIVGYATMTGETPGMMRSPTLALKAGVAAPAPGDTETTRWNKRVNTIDLALTKLESSIGSFKSLEQRQEFWRNQIGQLSTLKGDIRMKPVLEDILRTGHFDTKMLNGLKK